MQDVTKHLIKGWYDGIIFNRSEMKTNLDQRTNEPSDIYRDLPREDILTLVDMIRENKHIMNVIREEFNLRSSNLSQEEYEISYKN